MLRGEANDAIFSDIPAAKLDTSNLEKLLGQNISKSGEEHSMSTLTKVIKGIVGNHDAQQGRSHKVQTNGTCNHSSLCCWIETSLSSSTPKEPVSALSKAFDLYMAKSGLAYVKEAGKDVGRAREAESIKMKYGSKTETPKPDKDNATADIPKLQESGKLYIAQCAKELNETTTQQIKANEAQRKEIEKVLQKAQTIITAFPPGADDDLDKAEKEVERLKKEKLQTPSALKKIVSSFRREKTPLDAAQEKLGRLKELHTQFKKATQEKREATDKLEALKQEKERLDGLRVLGERLAKDASD